MLWLGLILVLLLGTIAGCWWGSNIVFYPPAKIPLKIFPQQFDLPYQEASFKTRDGITLRGWLIPAQEKTNRTIIFCHGWGDNKGDMLERFRFLHPYFNMFFFDNRAHGDSGGTHSSIGYLESIDFDAALQYLKDTRPEWIRSLGICGLSMGATVSIYGMANYPELRCAIFEAPFQSFNGVVMQFASNHFALPYFPFVWLTLFIIRLRLGGDPEPYSPTFHIQQLSGRPLLFISGEEDQLMPLKRVRGLYEMAGEPKEFWAVPKATHGRCQEVAGKEYERRITQYFHTHLPVL